MASQQPLVCTSLHLPPDLRPFLRIHEISLHVFLPNLDRLRLALEAERDINPEATEIFDETRKVLREELEKVFKVLELAQEVAERYSKVLEALSEKKPTQRPLYYVNLGAYAGRQCSEKALQAMTVFRRQLESAVSRVTATLNTKYKKRSKTPLTSTENTKSVSEILSAIDECNELLQQCHDQFANLVTQTEDESSVDSNPPSEEEAQVMRAKWQSFFDDIRGVWVRGFKIADEIQFPSLDNPQDASQKEKSRKNALSWRTLFQRQDKRDLVCSTNVLRSPPSPEAIFVTVSSSHPGLQTNAINPLNVTEGQVTPGITEVSDAIPPNGSPVPEIPFWRRIFRRTSGNNSTLDDGYHQQTRSKRWCF